MTVSVATGHVEYHPLYISISLVHNTVWRVHQNAVIPITFLAIPKGTFRLLQEMHVLIYIQAGRKYNEDVTFRTFKQQMYHDSIATVLSPLKSGMIIPVICQCPDGHF
jgi:Plavaka transposase